MIKAQIRAGRPSGQRIHASRLNWAWPDAVIFVASFPGASAAAACLFGDGAPTEKVCKRPAARSPPERGGRRSVPTKRPASTCSRSRSSSDRPRGVWDDAMRRFRIAKQRSTLGSLLVLLVLRTPFGLRMQGALGRSGASVFASCLICLPAQRLLRQGTNRIGRRRSGPAMELDKRRGSFCSTVRFDFALLLSRRRGSLPSLLSRRVRPRHRDASRPGVSSSEGFLFFLVRLKPFLGREAPGLSVSEVRLGR